MNAGSVPARVLVAPDKFKGTLSSTEAGAAMVTGLQRAWPAAQFRVMPLADGGEGFAAALVAATHGRLHQSDTVDARGHPCRAQWGVLGDGRTAVLDLAAAAGLSQLPPALRNPTETSTWGAGLVLREIAARGFPRILIGLGGSSTNDGGIGLAAALGYRFLDAQDRPVPLTGAGLALITTIETPATLPAVEIVAATDVDSPLFGPAGAAFQFARQKGASEAQVEELDLGLRHLAAVVHATTGIDFASRPGAGAAGGTGFGLMAFLRAGRQSGFDVLRSQTKLDDTVRDQSLVITGEGCLDATSFAGKAPVRVAQLAHTHGVPSWGVFGRISADVSPRPPFERWCSLPDDRRALDKLSPAEHAERVATAAYQLACYTNSSR